MDTACVVPILTIKNVNEWKKCVSQNFLIFLETKKMSTKEHKATKLKKQIEDYMEIRKFVIHSIYSNISHLRRKFSVIDASVISLKSDFVAYANGLRECYAHNAFHSAYSEQFGFNFSDIVYFDTVTNELFCNGILMEQNLSINDCNVTGDICVENKMAKIKQVIQVILC